MSELTWKYIEPNDLRIPMVVPSAWAAMDDAFGCDNWWLAGKHMIPDDAVTLPTPPLTATIPDPPPAPRTLEDADPDMVYPTGGYPIGRVCWKTVSGEVKLKFPDDDRSAPAMGGPAAWKITGPCLGKVGDVLRLASDDGWVKCSDELPEDGRNVVVWTSSGTWCVAHCQRGRCWDSDREEIINATHWRRITPPAAATAAAPCVTEPMSLDELRQAGLWVVPFGMGGNPPAWWVRDNRGVDVGQCYTSPDSARAAATRIVREREVANAAK